MRMEQNSRSSQGSDFEQFSKFLRMSSNRCNDSSYCNSNAYNSRNNTNGNAGRECVSSTRPLAMVYAEKQKWQNIYDTEIALINGTIFEELNLPFNKSGCSNSCTRGGCSR